MRIVYAALTFISAAVAVAAGQGNDPAGAPAKSFAPVAYFEENCAKCHGPGGSFFGEAFGKNVADLKEKVSEMAAGPAQAPVEGEELERLVAYHRALIDRSPFVAVTRVPKGESRVVAGEVSPEGTKVVVSAGKETVEAKVKGTTWEAEVPAAVKAEEVVVTAERGERKTKVELSKGTYSHQAKK